MKLNEALDRTIEHFGIKAKDLAAAAGMDGAVLSRFRNGRDMNISGFEKLLDALNDEEYQYLLSQLVLERKTQEDVSQLLLIIADKIERGEIRLKIGFPEHLLVG